MSDQDNHERVQTRAEEVANALSHGFGLLAAIAAAPFMIGSAMERGTVANVVGVSIFAATMMLMYLTSTLYHAVPHQRAKKLLRLLDHNAIYLLIAGTYTPIVLGVLYGAWGWTLFGLVWSLAVAGIVLKTVSGQRFHGLAVIVYVAMGWLMVVAVKPLIDAMAPAGIAWLVAGGLAYTGGIWFYRHEEMPYSHLIWHLFVLTGTVCHVVAIMGYGF